MKNLIKNVLSSLFIITIFSCASAKYSQNNNNEIQIPVASSSPLALEFNEIWGYLMYGEENLWSEELPITDIGYFTKAITTKSEVPEIPAKEKYFSQTNKRVHIVSSVDSKAQTHLLLDPSLPLRNKIIDGLINASQTYDGLQIDWELALSDDADWFIDFLSILKSKLNGKILSVAVPARTKTLSKDAYTYSKLAQIADRIIIMAYDHHWSTSESGPVAGTQWCKKIAEYSKTQIPQEKLIMGLSFYGRAWRDDTDGGKAYKYSTLLNLMDEKNIKHIKRDEDLIPNFTFTKKMNITVWFDDYISLFERTKMYKSLDINALSFWRIGQEDKNYWQYIKISK